MHGMCMCMCRGKPSTVQIGYSLNTFKVYFNDLITPALTISLAPAAADGGGSGNSIAALTGSYYLGFTSATHSQSTSSVGVCDWYFERTSPNHIQPRESCDDGFLGDSCALDSATAAADSDCLRASRRGCQYCVHHVRDCVWCPTLRQCLSTTSALLGASSESVVDSAGNGVSSDGGADPPTTHGVTTMAISGVNRPHHALHAARRRHPKACTVQTLISTAHQCALYPEASLSWVLYLLVVLIGVVSVIIGSLCLSTPPQVINFVTLGVTYFST